MLFFVSGLAAMFSICFFGYKKYGNEIHMASHVIRSTISHKFILYVLKKWDLIPVKTSEGYIIPYMLGTEHYHLFLENNIGRGPMITNVIADGDVYTTTFKKFYGTNTSIKNQNITPAKLGINTIEVHTAFGKKLRFESDDHITL